MPLDHLYAMSEGQLVLHAATLEAERDRLRACGLRVVTAYDSMLAASLESAVNELRELTGPEGERDGDH
jgi:hypothetical protein